MQAYLLTRSYLKTIEYKLNNSDSLEVNELSITGSQNKYFQLSNLIIKQGQSIPSFVSWIILTLGISLIFTSIYLGQSYAFMQSNLMNIVFFLASVTGALAFICKPVKLTKYLDLYSNRVVFELKSTNEKTTATFITDLNLAIKYAKEKENRINLKSSAKYEYEHQHKNVDDLFNLGLIDEVLYNRICNTLQEKFFGTVTKHVNNDNVIYLNK